MKNLNKVSVGRILAQFFDHWRKSWKQAFPEEKLDICHNETGIHP